MIDESKNLSLQLAISWHDEYAQYQDRYFLVKTNFWRDIYPPILDYQIKRAEPNQLIEINYKPGALLPENYTDSNIKTIARNQFNQYFNGPIPIMPAVGRFYPRGMIEGVAGCFKMDRRPFRIIGQTADTLDIDLNHPLARFPIHLSAMITDVFDAKQQKGGRCVDIAELLTSDGPGMQTLFPSAATEFFQGMPFSRKMEDEDQIFYDAIESKPVVDQVAVEQLRQFYGCNLKDNMHILDLMTGMDSYLPEGLQSVHITGLGLKLRDLQANSVLNQHVIHDLNQNPELPFKDGQFDAVICAFSVEYLNQPIAVFQQVARILKPGGKFLLAFSDRYYEKKVIALWDDVHKFERIGIVLEYFRQSQQFKDLYAESIRGLVRNQDDPFTAANSFSCPMFMLSGTRKG